MLEVAETYLETGSQKETANRLFTSTQAVHSHLGRIREYTGMKSSVDACNKLLYGKGTHGRLPRV